jgi:CheY-like chemotaxis protein
MLVSWWRKDQGPKTSALAGSSHLIVNMNAASCSSSAQYVGDASGPLGGLLFTWSLQRWPGNKGQQSTILLVESDDAIREAMTVMLVREGFFVQAVATARDALNVLRTPLSPIDLVLLDVDLPDVSGINLCARLRELLPRLPMMICTGDAEAETVSQLANLGVQLYLRKPFAGEKLLAAVQSLLR